jgi:hypothetical protein
LLADEGEKLRDKDTQASIAGTIYLAADGASLGIEIAEVAVKAVPVVGWAILGYQVVHAVSKVTMQ